MKKRILSGLLSLVLAVSFFGGCAQEPEKTEESEKMQEDGSSVQSSVPEIEITFWEQGWDGPIEDKILPVINEKANVNLKYNSWVVTSDEEQRNKLSLMVAGGDLPDVYFGSSDNWTWSLFNKLGEQGQLWNLIPFIKNHQNVMDYVSISVPAYMDPVNEELYILPTQMAVTPNSPLGYNIRQDWLDELNLDYPKTTEDFYNVLKQFQENIGDGNVIPLAFSETVNQREKWWIIPWFGEDSTTWSKQEDGTYKVDGNGNTRYRFDRYLHAAYGWVAADSLDPASISGDTIHYYDRLPGIQLRAGSTAAGSGGFFIKASENRRT